MPCYFLSVAERVAPEVRAALLRSRSSYPRSGSIAFDRIAATYPHERGVPASIEARALLQNNPIAGITLALQPDSFQVYALKG
jgi:hypothetical protein